jgi:hypothetical protein
MLLKWLHSPDSFLFQNLPIFLSKAFFKSLDSIILHFLIREHHISKKHIIKPKLLGGLSLPNFKHYYWAANARALVYWQDAYPVMVDPSISSWLAIEQDVHNTSLPALLFSSTKSPTGITGNNVLQKKVGIK